MKWPSDDSSPPDASNPTNGSPAMSAHEFRDDDDGYRDWLAAHPNGYVINILRSYNATGARLHNAGCRTLTDQISRGVALTRSYVKVCAGQLGELEQWALKQVVQPIPPCGAPAT